MLYPFISGTDEFHLSADFCSHHFLVGALLSEVRSALGEVAEVQRVAVGVLRDLLAKHSFDDRYLQSVCILAPACNYGQKGILVLFFLHWQKCTSSLMIFFPSFCILKDRENEE